MPRENRIRTTIAIAVGAIAGATIALAVMHFDDLWAWLDTPRWHYPELANVKIEGCAISGLPVDAVTYAVNVNRGDLLTDMVIPGRALHGTRAVKVTVTHRDKPVVLVLSSRRSVIWEVSIVNGVRLAAVLVLGNRAQGLVGIPKSIPHLIVTTRDRPRACPKFNIEFVKSKRASAYEEFDLTVSSITGRPVDYLQSAGYGSQFFAGPRKSLTTRSLIQSDELKPTYRRSGDVMPPGRDGLDWLMKKGLLRLAKTEDVDAWIIGATPAGTPFNRRLRVKHRMMSGRVFVILGKIAIPDRLNWDGDYAFILPDGTPEPDYASEARIYSMKDFSCRPGIKCRR